MNFSGIEHKDGSGEVRVRKVTAENPMQRSRF